MYVCICNAVSEDEIYQAAQAGASSLEDLAAMTGCGTVCGCCREVAAQTLSEVRPPVPFPLPVFAVAA